MRRSAGTSTERAGRSTVHSSSTGSCRGCSEGIMRCVLKINVQMCQNERGTKKADSSHLKNVSFTFLHQGISSPVNIRLISIVIWKKGVYVTNSRLITWLYFLNVYVCVCLNIIGEKMLFSVYDCFGSVLIISLRCHAGAQDKQKEKNLEKKSRVVWRTFLVFKSYLYP